MKLEQQEDGSIVLPLRSPMVDGRPSDPNRSVTLYEPSIEQLGHMEQLAAEADDKLNGELPMLEMPTLDKDADGKTIAPTPEQIEAARQYGERVNERETVIFSKESVYGELIVKFVAICTSDDLDGAGGTQVTTADLYGWSCSPRTARQILTWFQTPLLG